MPKIYAKFKISKEKCLIGKRKKVCVGFFPPRRREELKKARKKMEVSVSGNALKTFARSINCLAKIGNELAIQASSSQVVSILHSFISFFPNFVFLGFCLNLKLNFM